MRNNPYRHSTPPGWSDMSSAPRDGTLIEIQNNWAVAPWFGVFRWTNEMTAHTQDGGLTTYTSQRYGWSDGKGGGLASDDGPHLSWRPYDGDAATYRDPLGGAQDTRAYWLRAAGFNPADYGAVDGLTFAEELALERSGAKPRASARNDDSPLFFVLLAIAATAGLLAMLVLG